MHYLLFYDCAPDYLERRGQFRAEHLRLAWQAHERGELVLAGAFAEPGDGALLLFKCDSREVPERFAKADPYVANGLIARYWIRPWLTVAGADAANPLRPNP